MMNLLGIDFEEWFHPELIQNVLYDEKKIFKVVLGVAETNVGQLFCYSVRIPFFSETRRRLVNLSSA